MVQCRLKSPSLLILPLIIQQHTLGREHTEQGHVLQLDLEHLKTGSHCSFWTGLGHGCLPPGSDKLNVYSGLMSSCQEAVHGPRRLLADRDRGAREKQEKQRRNTREGMFCCPHRVALSFSFVKVSHLLPGPGFLCHGLWGEL